MILSTTALAQVPCPSDDNSCQILEPGEVAKEAETSSATLFFFWGVGCPHCEDAKPFIAQLQSDHPTLRVEQVEVKRDKQGRERFIAAVERLHIVAPGVPTFVYGDKHVVGFRKNTSEAFVRSLIAPPTDDAQPGDPDGVVELPLFGKVDSRALPLPVFTLAVGFVDGINPCAMWVLLVLLGILMHVKERKRLFLFGGTFVLMSGVVYFLFMTIWVSLFRLVGFSRVITIGLGCVVVLMGLINLKELFWFKKGVSLMISDKAKPGLYKRMRGISRAASLPAAFAGVVALAFVVNLIELGCTLGLPAIYTRILSLRPELTATARYGYLALYNVAYIVPLGAIVAVYAATFHRFTLGERGAKWLKGVSGVLLVLFGLLFIIAPEVLS